LHQLFSSISLDDAFGLLSSGRFLLVLAEGVSDSQTVGNKFKGWFKAAKGLCQMMDTVGLDTVYDIEVIYVQQRGVEPTARDWLKENYVDKGGKRLLG
jgi:3-hydroxyacyl-CoA dehydrogenase